MDCPALCTCKMMQGSGRCHLESVGFCFVREDLLFSGEFCCAPVCIAGAAVAELYFLHRVKVDSYNFIGCQRNVPVKISQVLARF